MAPLTPNSNPSRLANGDAFIPGQLTVEDYLIINGGNSAGGPVTLSASDDKLYFNNDGEVPVLDEDGKLDVDTLPSVGLVDVNVVASQAAMLALDAGEGDVASRSDLGGEAFICNGGDPTLIGSWVSIGNTVVSVAGKTGVVSLVIADVSGLQAALDAKAASSHTHAESDVTGLVSDLAAKAPLASPTFTGTPAAPTASAADNSTKLATTAYADAAAAAAIGAVTSVAGRTGAVVIAEADVTGLVSDLALKAPLASPTFTGTPAAPTQSQADGSTKLATTAYVDTLGATKAASSHTHAESDVTGLVSDLALKAPLASPSLTGNPTAPTQSAGNNSTRLATTAYVDTADALKANIASPTFTGTPAAPTPSAADNSTKLATTAYADTLGALKANIASPTFTGTPAAPTPSAADNSTKLATTAYVDTADALKANLASPTFTGTPAAPTPSAGDNSTKLATTAYVDNLAFYVAGGGSEAVLSDTQVICRHTVVKAFTLPTSCTGSKATIATATNATATFSIKKNGTEVATFAFATGSASEASPVAATFTNAGADSFAVGDVLSITGPASHDTTLAKMDVSIYGTLP